MFENPSAVIPKPEKEVLDNAWYDRFEKVASFSDFEYLTGNKEHREKQKNDFLNGTIENPSLDYPDLEKFNFEEREKELLQLKKDVLEKEPNETVKQVYRWRINEKIAELRMLKMSNIGNDKRFSKYAKFIYGQPEQDIYQYTIAQIKKRVDQDMFSSDMATKDAATKINKELFEVFMDNETKINPKNYTIPAPKSTKDEPAYSAEEIKTSFEKALNQYRLDGWEVVVDKEGKFTAINVSQEKKTVNIPQDRKLKETALQALISHEIGTHVDRREKGERSKLKLLGLGLDRYLKGEEGIATYQEQHISGANEFAGLDGHFAISLATGIDGKKRNFREVFEILKNYYLLTSSKKNLQEKEEAANNSAWNRCIRTFRGTTCQTPGACLTKDIVYREGNIGVWNIVKNNPEEVKRFSLGKYDPTNPRHIWILEQLGINEEDLEELEKE